MPLGGKLARELERTRAARAVARDDARAARVEGADLGGEVRGERLYALERPAARVEPGRMQPVERLLRSEVAHEVLVGEEVARVPADAVDRDAAAARLHRHDRLRVTRDRRGVAQELDQLGLARLQLLTQLRRKHAGGRVAAQPARLEREPDVAAAQLGEEIRKAQSSISSRFVSMLGLSMKARP